MFHSLTSHVPAALVSLLPFDHMKFVSASGSLHLLNCFVLDLTALFYHSGFTSRIIFSEKPSWPSQFTLYLIIVLFYYRKFLIIYLFAWLLSNSLIGYKLYMNKKCVPILLSIEYIYSISIYSWINHWYNRRRLGYAIRPWYRSLLHVGSSFQPNTPEPA